MSLPLNPEILEQAYEYLRATPPFREWNLPEGEDVTFKVARDRTLQGWYRMEGDTHVIAVSSHLIGRTHSLIELMAHEMVHLHQRSANMETRDAQHNAAFLKLAERVARIHGFDPKLF